MTSETVERLQISGCLVRMGGDVPRLQIQCDDGSIVEVANVAPDKLAAMPMLLYKRVTLTVEAEIQFVPAAAPDDAEPRFGPITSDPAAAERNIRAKEDAERSEYMERWKNAPEWAKWLAQDGNLTCWWYSAEPLFEAPERVWVVESGSIGITVYNVLGSTTCEPRPEVQS